MAFLTLNGTAIPIKKCEESVVEMGERARVFGGRYALARRASKRRWKLVTPPLSEVQAEMIRGMILGNGQHWLYDAHTYSTKGLAASTDVTTIRAAAGADGDPVYDENGIAEAKYGDGALAVEAGTTNLCAADARDAENAPTGYTAVNGATLSANTTHYWQGSKSLKVVTDAVGGGGTEEGAYANINPGGGSDGKTYQGTVYVKGDTGGESVIVRFRDVTNGVWGSSTTKVLTNANTWYRITASFTISGGDSAFLYLLVRETTDGSNITYYCDGWQIEEASMPTSWVDGTRAAGDLRYPNTVIENWSSMSYAAWVKLPTENPSANAYLLGMRGSASDGTDVERVYLYRGSGANNLVLYTQSLGGTHTLTYATTPWDDDWHHVAFVLRQNPETGEYAKELFFDGSSVATYATADSLPLFADPTAFILGSWYAGSHMGGVLDDLVILPYAVTEAWVTAHDALGAAMSALPRLLMAGDILAADDINVIGEVGSITSAPFRDAGTWRNNGRVLSFTLHEV